MIQRIQTLYIVFGVIALLIAQFVITLTAADLGDWILIQHIGLIGASVLAVVGIFLFGNRARQRKWMLMVQVLTLLAVAGTFYVQYVAGALPGLHAVGVVTWVDTLLPVAAYALFWLARRAIDRDIELVRSMDRLR